VTAPDAHEEGRVIVVWPAIRAVMRAFRPAAWLVLQDVALDAEYHDGRLVASTSARRVAEHLRLDPGTAAAALRVLRDRGVVELSQASGPNGRFGLATYILHLPDGIDVLPPCLDSPYTVNSQPASSCEQELNCVSPGDGPDAATPRRGSTHTVESHAVAAREPADAPSGVAAEVAVLPPRIESCTELSCIVDDCDEPDVGRSQRVRRRRLANPATLGQGSFDLGSGAQ
jgi:hypothetical protein